MPNTDILLSGAVAAIAVDLLVYPLDTIKTRLQSPSHRHLPLFRGLYQGLGPIVLATVPSSGCFFTVYEFVRSHLPSHPLSNAFSSGCAEICSCAIITPAEVIKQNAQVLTREPGGVNTTIAAFRNLKSMRDLWSGYGALISRNLPYTALQFPVFEILKKRWVTKEMGVTEWATWAGIAAGSSGSVAAVLTTPVDVVKTRIMLAAGEQRKVKVGEVVKEVLRGEGFHGLWRGGALRAVWTFAGSGLFLGTYEGSKLWLERRREAKEGVEEKLRL